MLLKKLSFFWIIVVCVCLDFLSFPLLWKIYGNLKKCFIWIVKKSASLENDESPSFHSFILLFLGLDGESFSKYFRILKFVMIIFIIYFPNFYFSILLYFFLSFSSLFRLMAIILHLFFSLLLFLIINWNKSSQFVGNLVFFLFYYFTGTK